MGECRALLACTARPRHNDGFIPRLAPTVSMRRLQVGGKIGGWLEASSRPDMNMSPLPAQRAPDTGASYSSRG